MRNSPPKKLVRSLSLLMITFFGLGNILGAGIYVLVGKVAGEAGYFTPLAFLIASLIAAISAFTYAELSSRFPVSAGEAVYIDQGLQLRWLAVLVGLLICLAGMVSTAVMVHGFAGYLSVFTSLPKWLVLTVVILSLGGLAMWGIKESVIVAGILTVMEAAGLLLVAFVGVDYLAQETTVITTIAMPELGAIPWIGVMSGAFLAFYAYIGFEDMVNVSEEVKNPEKNMPRAIFLAVVISTLFYSLVAVVAILVLTPEALSRSDAPLADVYSVATGKPPLLITVIGLFAVINGALIQMVMASRLLYGMANNGWLPKALARIHPKTHTPIVSSVLVIAVILVLSLAFQLLALAELTSYLILTVFTLVNLSLIRIKQQQPVIEGLRVFPIWVPSLGFATTLAFLLFKLFTAWSE